MNVRLSVAIMAHVARTHHAWWLAQDLHAPVVWDRGAGEWDTGARAISAYEDGATHHLIVQDDAVPVPDLRAHLEAAIASQPHGPMSLYLGTGPSGRRRLRNQAAIRTADDATSTWIGIPEMLHGVAIVLPVADIAPMLRWAEGRREPYDARIGKFYRHHGRPRVLYTWPSLVDHADGDTLIAVRPDRQLRTYPRVAYRHGAPARWTDHTVESA
ncbi:hypothetical protein [Microbacterium sp. 2FI]|uniref:hypothetical protein n=1 Tax=Microbacterium sp. 2FI TaxID=2502193 RepID=UPI0010FA49EB|nr:hypothetical protein [Microbacterium sp. 2FI]